MKTNKKTESLATVDVTKLNAVTGGAWNWSGGTSSWQNQNQWTGSTASNWSSQNWSR